MRHRQDLTEILLVGNPNAGKSTLFNALTGGHAKVGNWHGVTVGALEKEAVLNGASVMVCDLPGIYSLEGMSLEERGAVAYIKKHDRAFLLFVCECACLRRALPLFHALEEGRNCAVVLTKCKSFERRGGFLDLRALERELGVPVLCSEGLKKDVLKAETARLCRIQMTAPKERRLPLTLSERCYRPERGELSKADRLLTNGFFCIPFFLALLVFVFYVTFAHGMPGELCKGLIERFFTDFLGGYAERISSPVLRAFVTEGLLSGLGGVLCFLPQIALLFFFLILMEESGLLSRLAMLSDPVLSKIGLSGKAVFSLLMGFGCSAAAILTTRGLDDKQMQRRVILCLPYISCTAKLPVYLTLSASFFEDPFFAAVLLYALGAGIAFAVALFMKREKPPFLLELAPLQIPKLSFVAKALFFQIKQFIIKLATVIFAFFLASFLLSHFDWSFRFCAVEESMLSTVCGGLKYLFAPVGMNDWRIAYAALSGLVAKENVAGALAMFYGGFPYSAASAFAFAVFILTCSPCVSAIAASAKELGWRAALINAVLQTVSALLLCYFVYFCLMGGVVYLAIAIFVLFAIFILRKKVEKVHRKRGYHSQKLHR